MLLLLIIRIEKIPLRRTIHRFQSLYHAEIKEKGKHYTAKNENNLKFLIAFRRYTTYLEKRQIYILSTLELEWAKRKRAFDM